MRRLIIYLIILFALQSCGDGGGGKVTISLAGIWDGTYNFTVDECQFGGPDSTGITDEQVIVDNEGLLLLSSTSMLTELSGNVEEDGQVVFSDTVDATGPTGSDCKVDQSITYQDVESGSATSLFRFSAVCSDGFRCETRAIGNCSRRVEKGSGDDTAE